MEMLDVCNEEGFPTGEIVSRQDAHRDGILHRTAHVWVIRKSAKGYDVLLQKRSMVKDSYPGLYDTSSAGHIPAGDEPLTSAIRELKEELGIEAEPADLSYAGMFRIRYEMEFHGKMFRDNEVTRSFVYMKPIDIDTLTLQKGEVDEVRWFDVKEVYEEIQHTGERLCVSPVGYQVLIDYLASRDKN